MIRIYTDGASGAGGGKPGGWAYVVCRGEAVLETGYGGNESTTNNQMELWAAIEGLKAAKWHRQEMEPVYLVADSKLVIGYASGQYHPDRSSEETLARLAVQLRDLAQSLSINWEWIKGHQFKKKLPWKDQGFDVLMNHRADQLAGLGKKNATESAKRK